jgi:hypothetical protein
MIRLARSLEHSVSPVWPQAKAGAAWPAAQLLWLFRLWGKTSSRIEARHLARSIASFRTSCDRLRRSGHVLFKLLSQWLTSSMEAKNHSAERRLEPIVDAFSSAHDALSTFPEDQALFCYYALGNRNVGPMQASCPCQLSEDESFPSREPVNSVILNDLRHWASRDSTACRNQFFCNDLLALFRIRSRPTLGAASLARKSRLSTKKTLTREIT